MDVCQKQMEMEGYKILNDRLQYVDELKAAVAGLDNISILGPSDFGVLFPHFVPDNMGHDPLKILLDISRLPYPVTEIHRFLMDEVGIEVEKFTSTTILVLLTIGGTRSKMIRLFNALKKLSTARVQLNNSGIQSRIRLPQEIPPISLKMLPAEAFFSRRTSVPLREAVGRLSAGLVTPYPPGIPLLIPGQLLDQRHIDYLQAISAPKVVVQGLFDGEIYVVEEGPPVVESSR
jgi:arginine decarboxylase